MDQPGRSVLVPAPATAPPSWSAPPVAWPTSVSSFGGALAYLSRRG